MSMPRISIVLLAFLTLLPLAASAWERGAVQRFASLPPGSPNPEGITADRDGDIYVSGFSPTSPAGPGKVFVFDGRNGHLKRVLSIAGSSNALLGLGFTKRHRHDEEKLLVIDFGASQVLAVDKD